MFNHSRTGPLILVADDSRDVQRHLQKLLEHHGCRVCVAADGHEALAVAARQAPDLVLLDVQMPRLDGLATVRALKARPETAHIPVILLTALSGTEATLHGLDAGADEFLSKPVDEHELLARVRTLLRVKQQHDRLRDYQHRLTTLLRVTEQLRVHVEARALLAAIAALAHQHLGFGSVVVTLLDPEAGLLKVGALAGVRDARARDDLARTTYRWADVRALLRPEYQISESFLIPDEGLGGGSGAGPPPRSATSGSRRTTCWSRYGRPMAPSSACSRLTSRSTACGPAMSRSSSWSCLRTRPPWRCRRPRCMPICIAIMPAMWRPASPRSWSPAPRPPRLWAGRPSKTW